MVGGFFLDSPKMLGLERLTQPPVFGKARLPRLRDVGGHRRWGGGGVGVQRMSASMVAAGTVRTLLCIAKLNAVSGSENARGPAPFRGPRH
jgi:hypothetical protein